VTVVGYVTPTIVYSDDIYVYENTADYDAGTVYMTSSGPAIPSGAQAQYRRYWSVQAIPTLANSMLIGVRVVPMMSGRNKNGLTATAATGGLAEETTLTIVRSW